MPDESLPKEIQEQLKRLEKLEKAQKRRQAQQNEAAKRQYRKKKAEGFQRIVMYVGKLMYEAMRKKGYRPCALVWTKEDDVKTISLRHETITIRKKENGNYHYDIVTENDLNT